MQAALTTMLASETAAVLSTEASEITTTDHRTMAVSAIATVALTAVSEAATVALTVVSEAATAAPATTVVSETAAARTTAASEAEEVISLGATAAA